MRIYFDNAATTPLDKQVFQAMLPYFENNFGNPSSQYAEGRTTRAAIDASRKSIANLINASPSEIIFTSGGTESNNMALKAATRDHHIVRIISAPTEHHCVTHTLEFLAENAIEIVWLKVDKFGNIDIVELENLLQSEKKTLVSLMHANNEIGTLHDIAAIGTLCKKYNALFHTDTVQTFAHYIFDMQSLHVDFMSASAHKFHGPKGVGFLYMRKNVKTKSFIHGGGQERNMRAGTENIYGIVGLAKAAEIAYENINQDSAYIRNLKLYCIKQLNENIEDVQFNGDINGLYTVLNFSIPKNEMGDLFLFKLDMEGISISGGSACSSGAQQGSHVINTISNNKDRISLRVSFSKYNNIQEIDKFIAVMKQILYA
jgi:cysteine desulfurase